MPEQRVLRSDGAMDDGHSKRGVRVVAVDVRTDRRWELFLSTHPEAVIFQDAGWLRPLGTNMAVSTSPLSVKTALARFGAFYR